MIRASAPYTSGWGSFVLLKMDCVRVARGGSLSTLHRNKERLENMTRELEELRESQENTTKELEELRESKEIMQRRINLLEQSKFLVVVLATDGAFVDNHKV